MRRHTRTTQQHSNTCDSASPIAPPAPPVLLPAQPPAKHQVKSHECDQDDLAPHVSETRTSKSSHASQRAHTRPHVLRQTLAREAHQERSSHHHHPSEPDTGDALSLWHLFTCQKGKDTFQHTMTRVFGLDDRVLTLSLAGEEAHRLDNDNTHTLDAVQLTADQEDTTPPTSPAP
jgi:hypothetical protein